MQKDKYQKQLEKYRKEADEYFSKCKISPDAEDILSYVCDCVENESGCEVDYDNEKCIAKRLGITIDF